MTKVKKSFFERLTGASNLEEDIYEIKDRSRNRDFEMDREINVSAPTFYEEEKEEIMMTQPSRSFVPEENLSVPEESEGQLTIDVYQTDNDIVIKSTIAGVKPEDLDVSINNDMITIRGERKQDEQVSGENYYYQECYWGTFSRSVILPVDILPDKVEASMKNGILTIRMPKADTTRTKRIQVRGF